MKGDLYCKILEKFGDIVKFNVKASSFSSYKTGGNIDAIFYPNNLSDVLGILYFLKTNNIDFFICGRATNILVSDKGFEGVFIKTDNINEIEFLDELTISVSCGFLLDKLVDLTVKKGLKGLERLSWIPGSVGGAIKMNAGAFESETFDRLEYFEVVDILDLSFKRIYKKDVRYGYRYVEGIEKYFIIKGVFVLEKCDYQFLKGIREDIINKRIQKQPLDYPSAGSVFKRPNGDYASRLIDSCGLRGKRIGGAMVSEKHAGFIVNCGNATSSDIYNLITYVKDEVYKRTGVLLELEQILVGKF